MRSTVSCPAQAEGLQSRTMITSPTVDRSKDVKYLNVSTQISGLIDRGTFAPGSRIPSVRALSRQLNVSITTVMEAYRVLEDRGIIEARPQSGYFVRIRSTRLVAAQEIHLPERDPVEMDADDKFTTVLRDLQSPAQFALGSAVSNTD